MKNWNTLGLLYSHMVGFHNVTSGLIFSEWWLSALPRDRVMFPDLNNRFSIVDCPYYLYYAEIAIIQNEPFSDHQLAHMFQHRCTSLFGACQHQAIISDIADLPLMLSFDIYFLSLQWEM